MDTDTMTTRQTLCAAGAWALFAGGILAVSVSTLGSFVPGLILVAGATAFLFLVIGMLKP